MEQTGGQDQQTRSLPREYARKCPLGAFGSMWRGLRSKMEYLTRGRNGFGHFTRVEIPTLGPFERKRRENTRPISAGVNADAVRPLLDLRTDRVPVHDDATVVGLVEQERLA